MGWTFYHVPKEWKGTKFTVNRKSELDEHFTWSEGPRKVTVLKSSMVGSVYYAAVRSENKSNGTDITFGLVCLTSVRNNEYCNFGYKDMTDDMGPGYYDCPAGILDLLTEPSNEWAAEWRENCRKRIAERKEMKRNGLSSLPFGTVIEFTRMDGTKRTVQKMKPNFQFKTAWYHVVGDNKYYPKSWIPKEFTVVSRPNEAESV